MDLVQFPVPRIRHILRAEQFDRPTIDQICRLTTSLREHSRSKAGALELLGLFPHRHVLLMFAEPSSRTYVSFSVAAQRLGIKVTPVTDMNTSSMVKGESPLDTVRTFSSYVNCIVMRTKDGDLAERAAKLLDGTPRPVPIVNAGSGADEHPTQALLDLYTMQRSFRERGGLDGKVVALVGDLKRGRTVRSLARLAHLYHLKLLFVSPPAFAMKQDILDALKMHGVSYEQVDDLREATRRADVVYMTRVQDERDEQAGESGRVRIEDFYFTPDHLRLLGEHAIVMHPLPRRIELDPACDADSRVMIWRQERNGLSVREVLLLCICMTIDAEEHPINFVLRSLT